MEKRLRMGDLLIGSPPPKTSKITYLLRSLDTYNKTPVLPEAAKEDPPIGIHPKVFLSFTLSRRSDL